MKKTFTVIAEFWDNEQGFTTEVEAADAEQAMALAEAEAQAILTAGREPDEADPDELDEAQGEALRIWAVVEGAPAVVWQRDAA